MSLRNPRPIPLDIERLVMAYGFQPDTPKGRFVAEAIMEIEELRATIQASAPRPRCRGRSISAPITGGPWPEHVQEYFREGRRG